MIRDITSQIQWAFSKASYWDRKEFMKCLTTLETLIPGSRKNWDEYAGEKWGIILIEGNVLAYVNRDFPLLFIQYEYQSIQDSLDGLVVILFSDHDTSEFALETAIFNQWSQGRSDTGGLNSDELSASDIWWATIL
ncbi:hypothetical protein QGP82_14040 [Leptothoe sp. LEGE 181152]|uniref:Uncharacterized protein n=1 Tax=Adonisia turfae CCMR0081 TaxID=2292702 RepID=A0A6M0RGP8_9CYAN|nr:hypothetical protein [Adonisia turfae]MDV3349822.1 hypothetical protein [Leptothoe sp. LEGE 181152]NEZ55013.1 hypothetical protein [Adonisia turfae CCMR0081]